MTNQKANTLWAARFARFLQSQFPGSYGAYASLEQSWYNFEYYVLPRRVRNDDGTYSKAVVGQQLDVSTLYPPPWLSTPVFRQQQMSEFGTGIAVYFDTLLALTVILFVAGVLYLPTMYYYASDDYTLLSDKNNVPTRTGPLRGSLVCPAPIWVPCVDCDRKNFADNPVRLGFSYSSSNSNSSGSDANANVTGTLTFAQKNDCA
jgi:hypothetical protein